VAAVVKARDCRVTPLRVTIAVKFLHAFHLDAYGLGVCRVFSSADFVFAVGSSVLHLDAYGFGEVPARM
jgi:hypothetical protein